MLKRIKFLLILVLCGTFLNAQETELPVMDYSSPRDYIIGGITVSGVNYIDHYVVIGLSGLEVGSRITVPGEAISGAIEKLWNQGLFSDVRITATKIENNNIYLDIYLEEPPRLSTFTIEGLRRSEEQDLTKKLNLRSGTMVTSNTLNKTENTINTFLISKGFFNADININVADDPELPNRVILDIDIDKNDRVRIADINFSGNEAFSDFRLERNMSNTKKRSLLNIFKSSKFIRSDFEEDLEEIITWYNENGYRDAKIVADSVYLISENRIEIDIDIEEGKKYYFREIDWVGNTKYPSEYLEFVLGIEKGDVYDQTRLTSRLQLDDNSVSSLYLDDGYLFFQVVPVETRVEEDSIDLEMRIREGEQARINRIIITGNDKTNEHVIRRELRTKPGQLFSKTAIIRSQRELANLGHFNPEALDVRPIPNPDDGTVDIEYVVEEQANDQLEISGGWGAGMLIGTLGVRFNNFSTRNIFNKDAWRPLPSGDGQTLSIRAQSNGSYYQAYNISFIEPYVGGIKPNSLSLSAFHTIQTDIYDRTVQEGSSIKISGASVGFGQRLSKPDDFFTLYNEISYQNYNLNEWTGYFLFSDGQSNNLSFKTSFGRNSIDQPIYPRRGNTFNLTLQLTPPYSLINDKDYTQMDPREKYKWIEYHKWTFEGKWYTSIAGDFVFYSGAQFGILGHYNSDIGPSPFEGFDIGGDGMTGYNLYGRETISLRGYENGSITPIRDGSKAGNLYNKFTMELRYPISLNPQATIYVLGFIEGGNAWYNTREFEPFSIKRSAGIGVRAFLPMFGMLGVDWGYGFDEIPHRPGANKGQIHFVLGQEF